MNLRVPQIRHDDCDELAALCKAGGDPLRLNVLRALANDSFGVLELAQIFAIGQSGMSHHLKVLSQAGLVATRREGNAIFYRRAIAQGDRLGGTLHGALLEEVDALHLPPDVQARIAEVHAQREAVSREFFARSAEKFQAQQDLIAGLPQYRDSVLALLDALNLPAGACALEVGPGDGASSPTWPGASPASPRWTTARRCWNWHATAALPKDWATSSSSSPTPWMTNTRPPTAWC